jgi:hypothetical protein
MSSFVCLPFQFVCRVAVRVPADLFCKRGITVYQTSTSVKLMCNVQLQNHVESTVELLINILKLERFAALFWLWHVQTFEHTGNKRDAPWRYVTRFAPRRANWRNAE